MWRGKGTDHRREHDTGTGCPQPARHAARSQGAGACRGCSTPSLCSGTRTVKCVSAPKGRVTASSTPGARARQCKVAYCLVLTSGHLRPPQPSGCDHTRPGPKSRAPLSGPDRHHAQSRVRLRVPQLPWDGQAASKKTNLSVSLFPGCIYVARLKTF